MRKCGNCKNRCMESWGGLDCCPEYEATESEQEEIDVATNCPIYEEGTPECLIEYDYCASSTGGDYSPSNPWDAPGMSIRDFI